MQVGEMMSGRVVTARPGEPASTAWTRMRRRGIRHLVVMDAGELVGVLSERDLGGRSGARLREGRAVEDLMNPSVVSAEPDTSVDEAAKLMRQRLIGCLPVVDDGNLVGIVTATDVFDELAHAPTASRGRVEQQLLRAPSSSRRLGGQPVARRRAIEPTTKRARRSNVGKRDPLAAASPKSSKRSLGRTAPALTPANIRAMGVELDEDEREYIRRKLGRKLGKYAPSIERVTVRLRDVNGPRGGVDMTCRIKVVLSGAPSAVFEARGAHPSAAFDVALDGAERAVRQSIQQRRRRITRES